MKKSRTHIVSCLLLTALFLTCLSNVALAASLSIDAPVTEENIWALVNSYDPDGAYIFSRVGVGMEWFGSPRIVDDLSMAVHEQTHRYTRSCAPAWDSEMIYIGDGQGVVVNMTDVYPTEEMAATIPEEWHTFRYDTYVAPGVGNMASNVEGIYGLLNEFTAYSTDLGSSLNLYHYLLTQKNDIQTWKVLANNGYNGMLAYGEFKFWMLNYMLYAKEHHPDDYRELMENESLRNAYALSEARFTRNINLYFTLLDAAVEHINANGGDAWIEQGCLYIRTQGYMYSGCAAYNEGYYRYQELLSQPKYIEMHNALVNGIDIPDDSGITMILEGNEWRVAVNGIIDRNYTGMANNEYGWWYFTNGTLDRRFTGLAQNEYGWWYFCNGQLDFNYYGFASNEYGRWRIDGGAVNFGFEGVVEDNGIWRYYAGGQFQQGFTGIRPNDYGWWKIRAGEVDFNFTGLAENEYGWWYLENGAVNFNYYGFADNEYGRWRIDGGAVNFGFEGVVYDGIAWRYYFGGQLQSWANTIRPNDLGWWKIRNGEVDFGYTGLAENEYGWWYIRNGALDWSYTGVAQNEYGWWYIRNGALDWSYNGRVSQDGVNYIIVNGAAYRE